MNPIVASLSPYEMKLVTDEAILLSKNAVIQKVCLLFGNLKEGYEKVLIDNNVSKAVERNAKISKGENYKGLPYAVLDYPRLFSRDNVFVIRTFFWWGNFFSITLQLSGEYQKRLSNSIQLAINKDLLEGWSIGCSSNPWEHHFEKDNYEPIESKKEYRLNERSFIKIAKKIPLEKWEEADLFFNQNFTFLVQLLSDHAPIL